MIVSSSLKLSCKKCLLLLLGKGCINTHQQFMTYLRESCQGRGIGIKSFVNKYIKRITPMSTFFFIIRPKAPFLPQQDSFSKPTNLFKPGQLILPKPKINHQRAT